MKEKTMQYLEEHQSETPSKWREEAEWRKKNCEWLRYSQRIAILLLLSSGIVKFTSLSDNDRA